MNDLHRYWMHKALGVGYEAVARAQRPFGCVIVERSAMTLGRVIGHGEGSASVVDPTGHSEMDAIRMASLLRAGPLTGCTLYSTFEPCNMCCGAICHAKISEVVFGAYRADLGGHVRHKHWDAHQLLTDTSEPPEVIGGMLREQCIELTKKDAEMVEDAAY